MTYKPGDLCRITEHGTVEHYKCDIYADGVVTDVRTGKVLNR